MAAILTQIVSAEAALHFLSRRERLSKFNMVVVLLSAATTTFLAIRYLGAGTEEPFYFSDLKSQCGFIVLSGILMTLLSTVRVPALQEQISLLKCKNLLASGSHQVYVAGVGFGAVLSAVSYFFLGALLARHFGAFQEFVNVVTGLVLMIFTISRVYPVFLSFLRQLKNHPADGNNPESIC